MKSKIKSFGICVFLLVLTIGIVCAIKPSVTTRRSEIQKEKQEVTKAHQLALEVKKEIHQYEKHHTLLPLEHDENEDKLSDEDVKEEEEIDDEQIDENEIDENEIDENEIDENEIDENETTDEEEEYEIDG